LLQSYKKRLWHDMEWKNVEYSKNQIKAAGSAAVKKDYSKISTEEVFRIINNWRASHAYPLQVFYISCKHKAQMHKNAIAVQRLKRLDSILGKLERQPEMSLLRMQDLGGCRMIMDNINDVYSAVSMFKKSRARHELVREYDYIDSPKQSGYRSYHMVYKFYSDKESKKDYNGMLIEIQIRTKLQHLWATAIEVLGIYTENNLKAGKGDSDVLRYMELISALFAFEEGTAISDFVPQARRDIISEINSLSGRKILQILSSLNQVLKYTEKEQNKEGYYLLSYSYRSNTLVVSPFRKTDIQFATEMYERFERDVPNGEKNTVLVSASDIGTLKKAYPNYFLDVQDFVCKVKQVIAC